MSILDYYLFRKKEDSVKNRLEIKRITTELHRLQELEKSRIEEEEIEIQRGKERLQRNILNDDEQLEFLTTLIQKKQDLSDVLERGKLLYALERYSNAYSDLKAVVDSREEALFAEANICLSLVLEKMDDIDGARYHAKLARDTYKNSAVALQKQIESDYERIKREYSEHFFEQPAHQRKCLIIMDDIPVEKIDGLQVLDINDTVVKHIKWPKEQPQKGVVYVMHPHAKDTYFTLNNHEYEASMSWINEAKDIAGYLGAAKIEIYYTKNSSIANELSQRHTKKGAREEDCENSTGGDINNCPISVIASSGETAVDKAEMKENVFAGLDDLSSDQLAHFETYTYPKSSKKYSFGDIPKNIRWYPHDKAIAILVNHRLDLGLQECKISYQYSMQDYIAQEELLEITESMQRAKQINSELEATFGIFGGKSKLNSKKSIDSAVEKMKHIKNKTDKRQETIWHIRVQFHPMKQDYSFAKTITANRTRAAAADYNGNVPAIQTEPGLRNRMLLWEKKKLPELFARKLW